MLALQTAVVAVFDSAWHVVVALPVVARPGASEAGDEPFDGSLELPYSLRLPNEPFQFQGTKFAEVVLYAKPCWES